MFYVIVTIAYVCVVRDVFISRVSIYSCKKKKNSCIVIVQYNLQIISLLDKLRTTVQNSEPIRNKNSNNFLVYVIRADTRSVRKWEKKLGYVGLRTVQLMQTFKDKMRFWGWEQYNKITTTKNITGN